MPFSDVMDVYLSALGPDVPKAPLVFRRGLLLDMGQASERHAAEIGLRDGDWLDVVDTMVSRGGVWMSVDCRMGGQEVGLRV